MTDAKNASAVMLNTKNSMRTPLLQSPNISI